MTPLKYILRHYEPSGNVETDEIGRQEAMQLFGEKAVRKAEKTGIYERPHRTKLYPAPGHYKLYVEEKACEKVARRIQAG